MAARISGIFDNETKECINKCKLLVVGAGGIGCELLKTLVLTGFENIHVIDLDTIDLSNLNRQFLFHKHHIGKPKAVVAKESVLKFNPKANITAYHDSITNPKYNVEFYRQFTAVANALDNVAARSHVNRMCMGAEIPLIESGSAGYLGQTTVYKRKVTECFECLPRKPQKTYPGCTIRNTPSEPVHCIVWAKHLFNQLFGESDAEDEVSPDVSSAATGTQTENTECNTRISTREWAVSSNYDPHKIFHKLFNEDIVYLNSMKDLWEKRIAPKPLKFDELMDAVPGSSNATESEIANLRKWSLKECGNVFVKSLTELHKRVKDGGPNTVLVWDKDDDVSLDFVAACANLRSYCFCIQQKSRFDVKAIAGNIIPAIATTNAVVAGLVVLQLLKVIKEDFTKCKTSWINEGYTCANKVISAGQLEKPNPECMVCSTSTQEVTIKVNVKSLTLKTLEDKILKEKIHMVQPDVIHNDGSGSILISSDPDEMSDEQYEKTLSDFSIVSDSRLTCEDFLQSFKLVLVIINDDELSGQDFVVTSELDDIKPEEEKESKMDTDKQNNNKEKEEDCLVAEDEDIIPLCTCEDENGVEPPVKKMKLADS